MEAARPLEVKASVTQGLHSFGQSKSQGQCRLRRRVHLLMGEGHLAEEPRIGETCCGLLANDLP